MYKCSRENTNSCELALEEAYYLTAVVSQLGGFLTVKFMYYIIFIFKYFDDDSEGGQYLEWCVTLVFLIFVDSMMMALLCRNM